MRATEMHDLLLACKRHILENSLWHNGTGQFSQIEYCVFCGYSKDYTSQLGHSDLCLIGRLERATSGGAGDQQ